LAWETALMTALRRVSSELLLAHADQAGVVAADPQGDERVV